MKIDENTPNVVQNTKLNQLKEKSRNHLKDESPALIVEENLNRQDSIVKLNRVVSSQEIKHQNDYQQPRMAQSTAGQPTPTSETYTKTKEYISVPATINSTDNLSRPAQPKFKLASGDPIIPSPIPLKLEVHAPGHTEASKEEKKQRPVIVYKNLPEKPIVNKRSTTSQIEFKFSDFENDDKLFCFRN